MPAARSKPPVPPNTWLLFGHNVTAVYQQYVNLPEVHGENAIVTCFVIDGVPGAIAMRVGGAITDGHARFLSIGLTSHRPEDG